MPLQPGKPDLNGVRAALIDLDGTMVDTAPDMHAAVILVRAEFSLPEISIEAVRKFIGKGMENLLRQSLEVDVDAAEAEKMMGPALDYFLRHYAVTNGLRSSIYPGVIEGLEVFRQKNVRLACITNKLSMFAGPLMKKLGLMAYFDALYCADTLPRKKPDPLPLITACGNFGLQPHQAVAIGDSVNDAVAARAAGCFLLNVPYGYNHGESVQDLGADGIVESLLEAARLIH
jgi:phosphoglycolate phosphatase